MQRGLPIKKPYFFPLFDRESAVNDILSTGDLRHGTFCIGPADAHIPDQVGGAIYGSVDGKIHAPGYNRAQVVQAAAVAGRWSYTGKLVEVLSFAMPIRGVQRQPLQPFSLERSERNI